MRFNVAKCKVMHVGARNARYPYSMNGNRLDTITEEKDVGVKITSDMKPRKHCEEAANRANGVLSQIARAFHFRDRFIFKRLYVQYVRPHLDYCSSVWNPHARGDVALLERVQRRAVNMISGLEARDYAGKLEEIGLDSLERRRDKTDIVQVYKILNGVDKVDAKTWFTTQEHNRTRMTRNSEYDKNLIRTKVSRTDLRANTFSQRVINKWNGLPNNLKDAPSIHVFKRLLNSHLKEHEW
jgi:hypothetical protein